MHKVCQWLEKRSDWLLVYDAVQFHKEDRMRGQDGNDFGHEVVQPPRDYQACLRCTNCSIGFTSHTLKAMTSPSC